MALGRRGTKKKTEEEPKRAARSKSTPIKKPSAQRASPPKTGPEEEKTEKPSWLKRGADSQVAQREEATRRTFHHRFYMRPGESSGDEPTLTFLDGDLIEGGEEAGQIDFYSVREHEVRRPGQKMPDYYVCLTSVGDQCPLCESGAGYSFVALFSVIDHRTIKTRKGDVTDEKKLLAVKASTVEMLQKYATKNGGLTGLQFEVSRGHEQRSPKVGDLWIPTNLGDPAGPEEIDAAFGEGAHKPLNYEEVLTFLDRKALEGLNLAGEEYGNDDRGEDNHSTDMPEDEPAY
jgi:hypothetical protein